MYTSKLGLGAHRKELHSAVVFNDDYQISCIFFTCCISIEIDSQKFSALDLDRNSNN